jgi:hypothetical protein
LLERVVLRELKGQVRVTCPVMGLPNPVREGVLKAMLEAVETAAAFGLLSIWNIYEK